MLTLTGEELAGRDTLVVGGTGNVGTFLVDAFLRAGARVIVPSRSPEKLERLRHRLGPKKAEHLVELTGNIGTPEGAADVQQQLRDLTDDLYAAAAAPASWHQTSSMFRAGFADFQNVIETRLYPHYLAAEAVLPLLNQEGSYTTINGPAGFGRAPMPGTGSIAVVAAAQAKLIEAFAVETGGRPRVNDVIMMAFLGPQGTRPGSPLTGEQVGDFVASLASSADQGVHQQTIYLHEPRQVEDALAGTFA
ncbi:NAD(P)-dependent dehydrogenase (short-subunit alcohol dehydrogenase family) [Promicromonospora sp. AC04]|uniref:SDR family oxidoreductase n=1 Tax=Promicromonospora sp. AC04 TaxID=2135723 RepID=UPI000D337AA6|nr:SDR family oxidoreductase [Promicromonospora sp. AC04]PUB27676.1 NAD(P)-dependent dehydrogenase (short-subunit alcohol dehydrogenase family) [Promicromonospora sp. AC04]